MDNTSEANSSRWRLRAIVATAVTLGVTLLVASAVPRKLTVTIVNEGPWRLDDAVVHVTGQSYPLGDLEAGAETTVTVAPTSESSVEIEFVDSSGNKKRLDAECYLEPGYRGSIAVRIASDELHGVEHRIRGY